MSVGVPAVREATLDDAAAIADIYDHYVIHSVASFECEPVGAETMAERMAGILADGYPYLVATLDDRVVGYSHAARFRPREAYRYTVETTVYVAPGSVGAGVGNALYAALFERLRVLESPPGPVHGAIATIALPNDASVALHEGFGFEPTGRLPEVGRKLGRWIDVGYWHRFLGEPPLPLP